MSLIPQGLDNSKGEDDPTLTRQTSKFNKTSRVKSTSKDRMALPDIKN